MKKHIAIIGAGLSGLTLARHLHPHADVVVFEKARGVGGRMSTRYADPFYFDHGTPYFTARSAEFQNFLQPYLDRGVVAPWDGKVITYEEGKKPSKRLWFEPHFVACPHMNSLCKELAHGLDIRCSTEVAPLAPKQADGWVLHDKEGTHLGTYDWVICTAPLPQALHLLDATTTELPSSDASAMLGCYTLMIGMHQPWTKSWIAAKLHHPAFEWIFVNSSKPERNKAVTSLVIHTRHDWAQEHINDDVQEAQSFLLAQCALILDLPIHDAAYIMTHRWRYAVTEGADASGFCINHHVKIAATGDWASGSRIEDVWMSAHRLASLIAV